MDVDAEVHKDSTTWSVLIVMNKRRDIHYVPDRLLNVFKYDCDTCLETVFPLNSTLQFAIRQ